MLPRGGYESTMHAYSSNEDRRALDDSLTVGQAAHLTGISAKAIRYYEHIGVLPRPARSPNSYRRYGTADLNRLNLLRRIRLLGVPLSTAKALLAGTPDARCAEVRDDLLALVDQRLHAIDQEIAELQTLRAEVRRYQQSLAMCHPDASVSFSSCDDISCVTRSGGAQLEDVLEEIHACCHEHE